MSAESSSRRRPSGKPQSSGTKETKIDNNRPRKPRVETVDLSDDQLGKTVTGTICDVIRMGEFNRPAFGFINLGDNVEPVEDIPRIYFNRKQYLDESHRYPRRGYCVEFVVNKDDEGRFYASDVRLTEQGRVAADLQKLEFDKSKAERASTSGPATTFTSKPPRTETRNEPRTVTRNEPRTETGSESRNEARNDSRPPNRRTRRPIDDKVVNLKISVEGKEGVKDVEFKVGRALGALKRDVMRIFNARGNFVMKHITDEEDEGTFLTVAILKTLEDGDRVHFAIEDEEEGEEEPKA